MSVKHYICWFWRKSSCVHPDIILNGIFGILRVCASLLFVWACKQLIDLATQTDETGFMSSIILLVSALCVELLLSAIGFYLENRSSIRLTNKLRHDLFSKLMYSRWNGKERFHSGDAVNRLEEDVRVVTEMFCNAFPSVWVTGFQLVAAFLFLTQLDGRLAWLLVLIMPVFLIASKLYLKRVRKLTLNIRNNDSRVQSHIQENLQHKILIQTLGQNGAVIEKLGMLQGCLYKKTMGRAGFTLFSRTLVMTGFAVGYVTAFLWGVKGISQGTVSFGVMTAFLQLVGQIQRPMVELSRQVPSFVKAVASAERLYELDSMPGEEQGESMMLRGQAGIKFENVSFAYPDGDRQVIRNFSFDFSPGSRTAIIGETGAGKSTLIRLMLALLRSQQGRITIYDNEDELETSPLTRCNFVYVPQGNTLLSGTIRSNLLLAKPDATENQLKQVLTAAAAGFVYELPDGLDSMCGEYGTGLSEGQAQRICIARGLLLPGNILLLDELSSSLDKITERQLMERLISQTKDKTLIFITHREVITEYCGQVVTMEKEEALNNLLRLMPN